MTFAPCNLYTASIGKISSADFPAIISHLISAANVCVAGGKVTIGLIDRVREMEMARRARAVDAMAVGTREDLDIEDVASRRTDQAE